MNLKSVIGGLEKQQTIAHFRSPIASKSQDLTQFKSGTPHLTHHTIHSLNTYELEVSKNNQQNHIQYDHQELYYDNSDKYSAHSCHV